MGPMSVGHTPEMRVCPTANPSTRLVSGVSVGHFGEKTGWTDVRNPGPNCGPPGQMRGESEARGGSADVLADLSLGQPAERRELTEREIVLAAEFLGQSESLVGVEPSGAVLMEK